VEQQQHLPEVLPAVQVVIVLLPAVVQVVAVHSVVAAHSAVVVQAAAVVVDVHPVAAVVVQVVAEDN